MVEKDGKRYVRFDLPDQLGELIEQELRLRRTVLIKQKVRRICRNVATLCECGLPLPALALVSMSTCSDREDFEYPLLVGRNFVLGVIL